MEAFAGGASLGTTALFEGLVDRLTLIELDPALVTFWSVVFSDAGERLARIIEAIPDHETALQEYRSLSQQPGDAVAKALHLLLDVRLHFNGNRKTGGLLYPGDQKDSRWMPDVLASQVRALMPLADRVNVERDDALGRIPQLAKQKDSVFFLDPPYSIGHKGKGKDLYKYWKVNNDHLFQVLANLRRPFLLAHQDHPRVLSLAQRNSLALARLTRNNSRGEPYTELMVAHELWWLKRAKLDRPGSTASVITPGPLSASRHRPPPPAGLLSPGRGTA